MPIHPGRSPNGCWGRIVCKGNPVGPDFSDLIGVTSEFSARVSVEWILILLRLSGVVYTAVRS